MTREQVRAAISPQTALVCTLLGEAAGEPIEGQVAVACVIRNRATHPRWWGKDVKSVCLAKSQFSCWWEASPNTDRVYALAAALHTGQAATGSRSVVGQLQWIAAGVMDDVLLDSTGGSDHYITTDLLNRHPPAWAMGKRIVRRIGGHTFFRLEI